ncbi:MAG: DUF1003 domain-containing protein [Burkholderiales bacterium]
MQVPAADIARAGPERDQITRNLEAIVDFYAQETERRRGSQRLLDVVGHYIGRPVFLLVILVVVLLWIGADALMPLLGLPAFDPAPYHALQGVVALCALLATTVVLIKQNRQDGLAEQRAHLDLKLTLLTEQKAAKLIDLIEELRRDLPNVHNRADPEASALRASMQPEEVLAALDEGAGASARAKGEAEAGPNRPA